MKQVIVLCFFLVVLVAASALGDQDLLLSKQSKGFNSELSFAISPHNGDLMATWRRLGFDSFQSDIWVSRTKRKANGKYKKARAWKLSPPGGVLDILSSPRAAWIEENGGLFVAWARTAKGPTDIVGRAVTPAGKPKGELVSLTKDGKRNATPVVTASSVNFPWRSHADTSQPIIRLT